MAGLPDAKPATAIPAATPVIAVAATSVIPRLGAPAMSAEAIAGAFQQRTVQPPTVSSIAQSSLNPNSGPLNREAAMTGSTADVMNASTISLIPAATTAPTAFSARNFVDGRSPKGSRIPMIPAKR